MPRGGAALLASLLLGATLFATLGLGSPVKEKRGWTLNSAGYLLGPHAVDNHRSFQDKHGPTGKRGLQPEDDARSGSLDRLLPVNDMHTVMEFLRLLHLKEAGALVPALQAAVSLAEAEQGGQREPGKLVAAHEVRL